MKMDRHTARGALMQATALCLSLLLCLSGCAQTVVQIRPPYPQKVRPGDGVKITTTDGTIHSGRITYVDRAIVVIRTPRQTISNKPVKRARYATTVRWEDVRNVKVGGTLDSRGKLISNEEIRINRRTHHSRKLPVNIGLAGTLVGFLAGVQFQDSISPPTTDPTFDRHDRGRLAFWATWMGGTLASVLIGYRLGVHLDRKIAIARIERQRREFRKAQFDSLLQKIIPQPDRTGTP